MIYHLTNRASWQRALTLGSYRPNSLKTEGFIHCSTAAQVNFVANSFYRGQIDLILLYVDPEKLTSSLVWEAPSHPKPEQFFLEEPETKFPHIYGELNLEAVVNTVDLRASADGNFNFCA